MLALCVESSHARGMGHFFRALHFIAYLKERKERNILLVNEHAESLQFLARSKIRHAVVPLYDLDRDWESSFIRKHGIGIWINDRLDTDIRHSQKVKYRGIKLVTFDDRGSGAAYADLHFAPLAFDDMPLQGGKILRGPAYLVLNRDIERYKALRSGTERMVVSMGGSDTHGITVKVVEVLKQYGKSATIILGPGFRHERELGKALTPAFLVKRAVSSLVEEFSRYDLAITCGGVTAFEACASGLPCIIIAAEIFEVPGAKHLEQSGAAVFGGVHTDIDGSVFSRKLDAESMSRAGMNCVTTKGAENVYRELMALP